MESKVYKNRQLAINLWTFNITKWGTKKKLVENISQRPDIIGREARKFCCCGSFIIDHFCGVHQSIGAYHP